MNNVSEKSLSVFEKFKSIFNEVAKERGPLTFAALIEREEAPGKFDIVVSATWIGTEEKPFMDYLVRIMKKHFTDEEFLDFSGFVILNPAGEFMLEWNQRIGPLNHDTDINDMEIANANVRYGHIFATNPVSYVKAA